MCGQGQVPPSTLAEPHLGTQRGTEAERESRPKYGGGIATAWKLNEWTQHTSVLEKEKKEKGRNVVCVCGRSDGGGDDTARCDEVQTDKPLNEQSSGAWLTTSRLA